MDGPVHVTLRRKVNDGAGTATPQKIANQLSVGNIAMHEAVARIRRNLFQIAKISGISKLVQIHHWTAFSREPLQDEIGTDKTGSSGYQNGWSVHL
jgi:hypothetical protein